MEKNNDSIWFKTIERKEYNAISQDLVADICIIGGGITGISTAYYLSKQGLSIVLVEKDKIFSKTTGCTTGKITSQHKLFYKYLLEINGRDYTKKYLEANEDALKNIEKIIEKEKISCDFERKDAFVFTIMPEKVKSIVDEVNFTKSLGVKSEFIENLEIPLKIHGAIKFKNQAQFNPVKYVYGLLNSMNNDNVKIYEHTKAIDYRKEKGKFKVKLQAEDKLYSVTTNKVVVATRYPIFNFPGMYFIKNYQDLEYAMCIKVNKNIDNYNMYVSCDMPSISFRTVLKDNQRYLLVVGNGSKTGKKDNVEDNFRFLENIVKSIFSEYEIICKWFAEDVVSIDKIPYIGRYSNFLKDIYVATGFNKWGMTFSNIAAKIISDDILNIENKYNDLFNPVRLGFIKNKDEMKNMIKDTYSSLVRPRFSKNSNKKYCTHLGCELKFNKTTNEWECPCHGSRFEINGKLIDGPSRRNLE